MAQYKYIAAQPVYICAPFVFNRGRSPGGVHRSQYRCVTAKPVHARACSQCAVSVVRPRQFLVLHQKACRGRSAPEAVHVATACGFSTWCHHLRRFNRRAFNALRAASTKCLLGGALRRCPLRVSTVGRHLPAMGVHRLRSGLWRRPNTFTARKSVALNTVQAVGWRRCLTRRSS